MNMQRVTSGTTRQEEVEGGPVARPTVLGNAGIIYPVTKALLLGAVLLEGGGWCRRGGGTAQVC